jgi:hypothetical protein
MRASVLPSGQVARVAWAAWLVLVLVPALALAAPRTRPKKPPKKPPVAKPEPAAEPAPAPDADAEPAKDARTPASPSPAAASPGSAAGGAGGQGGGAGAGGGNGADGKATPPADQAEGKPASGEPDVDALRQEYLSLRDELFKSRARANAVASQLYSTRMQIKLTYTTGRYYSPVKSSIRLDGAVVYEDAKGSIAEDDGLRFDGYVAPGRHLVTFRVEAVGKDDDTFSSVTETQVVVKAVADKDLVVTAKAKDSGDIAYEWQKKEKGSYGLSIDVSVKAQPRPAGGKGTPK